MDNKGRPVKMTIVSTSDGSQVLALPLSVIGSGTAAAPGTVSVNTSVTPGVAIAIPIGSQTVSSNLTSAPPAPSLSGAPPVGVPSQPVFTNANTLSIKDGDKELKIPVLSNMRSLRTRTVVINSNKITTTSPATTVSPTLSPIASSSTLSSASTAPSITLQISTPSNPLIKIEPPITDESAFPSIATTISTPPPPPLVHISQPKLSSTSSTSESIAGPLPTLTPATLPEPMIEDDANDDKQENSQNTEDRNDASPSSSQETKCSLHFDPSSIMVWEEGVGILPGSSLKFKINDIGTLEIISDQEAEEIKAAYHEKVNGEGAPPKTTTESTTKDNLESVRDTSRENSIVPDIDEEEEEEEEQRICVNCGNSGPAKTFIRAGKFCSQECAAYQASQLRALAQGKPKSILDRSKNNNGKSVLHSEQSSPVFDDRQETVPKKIGREFETSEHLRTNSSRSDSFARRFQERKYGKKKFAGRFYHFGGDINSRNGSLSSIPPSSSVVNITPQSALHQSIFSMRAVQHHQESSLGWERHSQNLRPYLTAINPSDVLKWDPENVSRFVNSIPGCNEIGQIFTDEQIDGEAFLLLNQQDLVKVLNIKLGPAVKIHNSIILLRDAIEA